MIKPGYRYDIAVLRVLSIIIVVFFHAYGMMCASHFPTQIKEIYKAKYELVNQYGLINIAMPMFIFISGFLYGGQLMKAQKPSLPQIFKGKFKRLMVPFFVFAVLFMFTQNAASWKPLYQWTYLHLWYLPMLFWSFIVAYFLRLLILNERYSISLLTIIAVFAISLIEKRLIPMVIGLHNVQFWICWFVLGIWFCKHEDLLSSKVLRAAITICGGGIYVALSVLYPIEYGARTLLGQFTIFAGLASMWCLISFVDWKRTIFTKTIVVLSGASFGIYIFHNWLEAFMISTTAQRLLHLGIYATNYTTLFPFIFSTLAFVVSFVLTWLLLQTKIGKQLIG